VKQTRVLHLVSKTFGGIESYVFGCYRHINRDRFQFDFLTQNPRLKDAEQYNDLPYQVHLLRTTAAQGKDRFARQIREILENGKYDILHLHTSYWTGFLIEEIAKDVGIQKIIVHSHNSSVEENDDQKRPLLLQRHEELKKAFTPDLATDFWACSQLAADWLFGPQIPREKIKIMKNGIEVSTYRFDPRKRAAIRTTLSVQDTFVLGTVGRLSYQKNQEFLIDLFEEFYRKYSNSKLLLLGDGERRKQIELRIQEKHLESSVILLGWKNNVADYLQAMDCFLLPSRFEGLPISILEATASGIPCICSDRVSEEIEISQRIKRIPLEIPLWVSALEDVREASFNRKDGVEIVQAAGYDIRQQAKVIEKLYDT